MKTLNGKTAINGIGLVVGGGQTIPKGGARTEEIGLVAEAAESASSAAAER